MKHTRAHPRPAGLQAPYRRLLSLRPRRALFGLVLVLATAVTLPVGWATWLRVSGNFHTVVESEVYRSAQPGPGDLEAWAAVHGIRSVLNLRGPSDQAWYRDEIAASERLGLVHADFGMRASEMLSEPRAQELIALMKSLPKPLLIHCKQGADRTGIASALYLAARGDGEARAEAQISFRYGHVSLPLSAAWPIDQSWEALEIPLGFQS